MEPLPDNVYDGFVSPTSPSYFDKYLQEHLHDLYMNLKGYNEDAFPDENARVVKGMAIDPAGLLEDLSDAVEEAINLVEKFRRRNKPTKRWRTLLKAIHWYYDD